MTNNLQNMRGRLNNKVKACFGVADYKFALHPMEVKNAKKLLKELKEENADFDKVLSEFQQFLSDNNCTKEHISNEMSDIMTFFNILKKVP